LRNLINSSKNDGQKIKRQYFPMQDHCSKAE